VGRLWPLTGAARGVRGARWPWLLGALSAIVFLLMPATRVLAAEARGKISGEVTIASSHAPLEGIEVCAFSTNYELLTEEEAKYASGCAKTGANGEYTVSELRPESYYVEFGLPFESKLNYIAQLYNDKFHFSEASSVSVVAGETTAGIDAELSPGAEIAGRVTDAETGAPIGGAVACALSINAQGGVESSWCAVTEASGEYTIRGLMSGAWKVGFGAPGFEVQFYGGKSAAMEAESVSVIAPNLTPGIDVALKPAGPSTAAPGSPSAEPTSAAKLSGGLGGSSSPDSTLSLTGKRITVARDRDALVKIECAGTESCRAKLTLRVRMAVRVKGKRMLRSVTIGTSAILSVPHGKTATARIKLDSAGRKLLRDHGRAQRPSLELAEVGAVSPCGCSTPCTRGS
jgi:hypothetical protein